MRDLIMLPVLLVYLGLLTTMVGLICVLRPLAFLKVGTRRRAALLVVTGFGLIAAGFVLPASETRVTAPQSRLDEFAPIYQFHEIHSIRIQAPPDRVYAAVKGVRADEIAFFRTLTWIRRGGQSTPESIMNAPGKQPLLAVATRTSFLLLAENPDREIVVGSAVLAPRDWRPSKHPTPEDFKTFRQPGFALASMNFLLQDDGSGATIVTTETRVYATDPSSVSKFARYWRVIYPGSALIRRMWLRAIKARAESANTEFPDGAISAAPKYNVGSSSEN